jgi:Zn-dependent M28 family amino/carboxypeptidase
LSPYEVRRGMTTKPMAAYGRIGVQGERPLAGAWISPEVAERILSPEATGTTSALRTHQEGINETRSPRSQQTGTTARLTWQSEEAPGRLVNVLGLLQGEGPRAAETVILGAHRDHFGRQAGLLFPGADDNASGTAIILEVARVLAHLEDKPKRSLLFVSFSGEEQGLRGSRLYVEQPARSLSGTAAMINVDHAGVGNGRLTVGIQGLPKETALAAGRLAGSADHLDLYGYFPGGDHVPFKETGVSTTAIVSAGSHPHFHQPSDQPQTLKPEVLQRAARYVLALVWSLSYLP